MSSLGRWIKAILQGIRGGELSTPGETPSYNPHQRRMRSGHTQRCDSGDPAQVPERVHLEAKVNIAYLPKRRTATTPKWQPLQRELSKHGAQVSVDHSGHRDLTDRDVGILQAVAGQHADHRATGTYAVGESRLDQTGH